MIRAAPARAPGESIHGGLRTVIADLHLHTCLSPCAELEMVPTAIVRRARSLGLDSVAICDHNSTANAAAVARAGSRESFCVIPGVEITTREEVHVLGLFGSARGLAGIQSLIDRHLKGENDEETFGMQVVVDEWDEPVSLETRLLIGATELGLEEVVDAIHALGGLAIAAHVDREGFGLLGQLGFVPPGLPLDGIEVSHRASVREWSERFADLPVITSSDAHRLREIGRSATSFLAAGPGFEEIARSLRGRDGRRVVIH